MIDHLQVEIEKLSPKCGDLLFVKVQSDITYEDASEVGDSVNLIIRRFPGVVVFIGRDNLDLKILSDDELAELGLYRK